MKTQDFKEYLNCGLYAMATLISQLGSTAYTFAMGLYVLKQTGSGMDFAFTLAAGIVSTVVANPVAGVLADRIDRKTLAIAMDLLSALTMLSLYLMTLTGPLSLVMIYTSTFVLNGLITVYGVAIESAKPRLVNSERLMSLNAVSQVINAGASILGPAVGGLVFAFMDIRVFVWANGLSFAMSALLQIPMNFKLCGGTSAKGKAFAEDSTVAPNEDSLGFWNDLKVGWQYLGTRKDLVALLEVFIMLNFVIGLSVNVPMPYIVNRVLGLQPTAFGMIQAALPVGMIIGALVVNDLSKRYAYETLLLGSSTALSLCMVLMGMGALMPLCRLIPWVGMAWFTGIMVTAGVTVSLIDIPLFSKLQQTLPDHLRGRVLSLGICIVKVVLPLALILSGALVNRLPAFVLPMVGGVLLFVYIASKKMTKSQFSQLLE